MLEYHSPVRYVTLPVLYIHVQRSLNNPKAKVWYSRLPCGIFHECQCLLVGIFNVNFRNQSNVQSRHSAHIKSAT